MCDNRDRSRRADVSVFTIFFGSKHTSGKLARGGGEGKNSNTLFMMHIDRRQVGCVV